MGIKWGMKKGCPTFWTAPHLGSSSKNRTSNLEGVMNFYMNFYKR